MASSFSLTINLSSPLLSVLVPFSGTVLKQSPLASLSSPGPSEALGFFPIHTDAYPEVAACWECSPLALCHRQELGQPLRLWVPGYPGFCSPSIREERPFEEGCFLAASLLLLRLPWLRSRVLGKPGLSAQGRQRFHRLRAFNSAGSPAAPLCDWKRFPAHCLLGKEKYPKWEALWGEGTTLGWMDQCLGKGKGEPFPC